MGQTCTNCGAYTWTSHTCPPKWRLWQPEDGETEADARDVFGRDAEEAVERWAARDDAESADYSIVGGGEATVLIRPADDDDAEPLVFVVSGESVPQYHASKSDDGAPLRMFHVDDGAGHWAIATTRAKAAEVFAQNAGYGSVIEWLTRSSLSSIDDVEECPPHSSVAFRNVSDNGEPATKRQVIQWCSLLKAGAYFCTEV